jgi:hypothetical protein
LRIYANFPSIHHPRPCAAYPKHFFVPSSVRTAPAGSAAVKAQGVRAAPPQERHGRRTLTGRTVAESGECPGRTPLLVNRRPHTTRYAQLAHPTHTPSDTLQPTARAGSDPAGRNKGWRRTPQGFGHPGPCAPTLHRLPTQMAGGMRGQGYRGILRNTSRRQNDSQPRVKGRLESPRVAWTPTKAREAAAGVVPLFCVITQCLLNAYLRKKVSTMASIDLHMAVLRIYAKDGTHTTCNPPFQPQPFN